jgi:hypothetical protein
MKCNTKNIMKSKFESDNMNIAWRSSYGCRCFSGMPSGKCLNSKNSKRVYHKMLKNKWRREVNRQFNEEINELWEK